MVDAQIYFKIKPDEVSVQELAVQRQHVTYQIVSLARTTLRTSSAP